MKRLDQPLSLEKKELDESERSKKQMNRAPSAPLLYREAKRFSRSETDEFSTEKV